MVQTMVSDTADAYGAGHNEALVRQARRRFGHDAFLATKSGIVFEADQPGSQRDTGWGLPLTINGSKTCVERAIDHGLRRHGVEQIDLLYAHHRDPSTLLEETVSAMAEAVQQGKVKAIGLSNGTVDDSNRANQLYPVWVVHYAYSLFSRESEYAILPPSTVSEWRLRAAHSWALTSWPSPCNLSMMASPRQQPMMQGENFILNLQRLETLVAIASVLSITPAQLPLVWLPAQADNTIPMSGSRSKAHAGENPAALAGNRA
ncbi:aldo/keto reductase [Cyanobium sp. NIES-981]|uniref:aldo/keto reductase n=1 Tax=Cyanobium sp. NIES-981 TaxID=1851505 RepID=UPI0012F7B9C2|nr:aldo/keto reductase [Cyanobium sp. NIES-981]